LGNAQDNHEDTKTLGHEELLGNAQDNHKDTKTLRHEGGFGDRQANHEGIKPRSSFFTSDPRRRANQPFPIRAAGAVVVSPDPMAAPADLSVVPGECVAP